MQLPKLLLTALEILAVSRHALATTSHGHGHGLATSQPENPLARLSAPLTPNEAGGEAGGGTSPEEPHRFRQPTIRWRVDEEKSQNLDTSLEFTKTLQRLREAVTTPGEREEVKAEAWSHYEAARNAWVRSPANEEQMTDKSTDKTRRMYYWRVRGLREKLDGLRAEQHDAQNNGQHELVEVTSDAIKAVEARLRGAQRVLTHIRAKISTGQKEPDTPKGDTLRKLYGLSPLKWRRGRGWVGP